MTREIFTPSPLYTIATAGPYPITYPYQDASEITATVFQGDAVLPLVNGTEFTVSPNSSSTTGDVTLSSSAFAAYVGARLQLRRTSVADQGWSGQSARERGLEAQLDSMTQRLQEIDEAVSRSVKIPSGEISEMPIDYASTYPFFDANKKLKMVAGVAPAPVSPYMATLLDDPDAKTARETLGGFDAVSDLIADTTLTTANTPVGTIITAQGFRYKAVASGGHIINAGGVQFIVLPGDEGFAALAFGVPSAATANAAFDAVVSSNTEKRLTFNGEWYIETTVTLTDPQDVHIEATGAIFKTTQDILMFDLNGRADPTYTDNESRQNFAWVGGRFICLFTAPTKATVFRALGFRHMHLRPEHFTGFYRDIITGGKDTVTIGDYKTYDVKHSIEFPPWSTLGGPLNFLFRNLHASIATKNGKLLKSWQVLPNSKLENYSTNLGNGATVDGAIDVARWVMFGADSITGTFVAGETITGGTSGATVVFEELYVHDFPFAIPQVSKYLVCKNRTGTFSAGEVLTGGTSGAVANINPHVAYTVQNQAWSDFTIAAFGHSESGSAAAGAIAVRIRDMEKSGIGTLNFDIDIGSSSVNGGGAIGIELDGISNAYISGRFGQTVGSGTPIKLSSDCNNIVINPAKTFTNGVLDLNGMSRDELDLSGYNIDDGGDSIIIGFDGVPLTGAAAKTILDMSVNYGRFKTVMGLPPRGYVIQLTAVDTASATAAAARPRFRIYNPGSSVANRYSVLNLNGVPNGEMRSAQFFVGADGNGDIAYDFLSGGTMNIWMRVVRVVY